ncbi:hypothetical protein GCM10009808_04500 [Microbacterium sediminicola]|uniref:HTH marR-type domain-containing protein n=1 Tax=Microbacterium sediminicola TaxID=415210 RepID=A0ABN2HN75_9MICO
MDAHQQAVFDVLVAIRALNDAMDRMNGGMKGEMDMNVTDLAALRMLIIREQRGESVSPHHVAEHLKISTASTTKLLDRLERDGYLERQPHPSDRRSRVVALTDLSRQRFFQHFARRLQLLRGVTEPYSEEDLRLIEGYLDRLSEAIEQD